MVNTYRKGTLINSKVVNTYMEDKDVEFIKENYSKFRDIDLAKKFGVCASTIRRTRRLILGIKRNKRIRLGDKPTFNINYFDELTEENCYVLGYLFADGWLHRRGENSYTVGIELKDKNMIFEFANLLETTNVRKHRNNLVIAVGNLHFAKRLMELGFKEKKARTLSFPPIPKKFERHFIRGYFDGDGCICLFKDKRSKKIQAQASIASMSILMLEELQKRIGFGKISKSTTRTNNLWFGKKECFKLYDYFYKEANIFLPRKKEKFEVLKRD